MAARMNAAELAEALGARSVAGGVAAVAICGPIEVATARDGSDAGMRRAWRDRQKGRATPLLVVHDAGPAGMVKVLGPTDDRGVIREVDADRLVLLLERTSVMSRLLAAREVSEELTRMDSGGMPGV